MPTTANTDRPVCEILDDVRGALERAQVAAGELDEAGADPALLRLADELGKALEGLADAVEQIDADLDDDGDDGDDEGSGE